MNLIYVPIILATMFNPLLGSPPAELAGCKEGELPILANVVYPETEGADVGIVLCMDPTQAAEKGVKINPKDPRTWKAVLREIVVFPDAPNGAVEL